MREIIDSIDTPDGFFHDGNPATGELGTIVPAGWLNDVQAAAQMNQAELIRVLAAAGIAVNAEKSDQLLSAVLALLAGDFDAHIAAENPHTQYAGRSAAIGYYDTLPVNKQAEPMIYVPVYGLMHWAAAANMYRSDGCGLIMQSPIPAAWPGTVKANGGTLKKTDFAGLWSWAQENGLVVPAANWVAGTAFYADLGGDNFKVPDIRSEFVRMWDDGRNVDTGRAFGTSQGDAIRNFTGAVSSFYKSQTFTASGVMGISAYGTTPARLGTAGSDPGDNSTINIDPSRQVPTASENRPRNVALTACIKF